MYIEKRIEDLQLSQSIAAIWRYEHDDGSDSHSIIFPDASVDIIFKQRADHMEVWLCGVMNKAMQVQHQNGDRYYGIRFKPGYAWAYFDKPMHSTLNQMLPLYHFFEPQAALVEHLKHDSPDLAAFEQFVQAHLLRKVNIDKLKIIDSHTQALSGKGCDSVLSAASARKLSRRHFSRCFQAMYGISPRDYANIQKLNVLRALPQDFKHMPLVELALMLGYCDQSHMNHSLKRLTGLTPKALMSQSYNT